MSDTGRICIRANSAELKKDKNIIFKADPYCVFYFGNQVLKTQPCKKGGKHPAWEETIIFERTTEQILIVQLWDKDIITKDDFIGEGSIDIVSFLVPGNQSVSIDLFHKGECIGKLFVQIEFIPQKNVPQTFGTAYGTQPLSTGNKF